MNIIQLPEHFGNDIPQHNGVLIHNYKQTIPSQKSKVFCQWHIITFLLQGQKEIYRANNFQRLEAGNGALIAAGQSLMSEKLADNNHYQSMLLMFNDEVLNNFFTKYPHYFQEVADSESEYLLTFPITPYLYSFLESLKFASVQQYHSDLFHLKLDELFLYLLQSDTNNSFARFLQTITSNQEQAAFKQIIERNITSDLTLEELAFLCNMSLSTFKRYFNKVYGIAPQKWFREQRMQLAADWLKNTASRPSEIYFELGYENLSSFIQAFKLQYGITPKQYQLQLD